MRLQTRLLMAIGYVLVIALVAFLVPLAINYRERTDSEVRVQASGQADLLAVTGAEDLNEDPGQLQPLVEASAQTVRGRVLIVDRRGVAIADSGGPTGSDLSNRPEIRAALEGRKLQLERDSASLETELLATAVPIREEDGEVLGAVRITQSVEAVDRAASRSLAGLILVGGVVMGIGLLAGVFIARQLSRPIQDLTGSAERIAAGDLDERASVEGSAEQRTLSLSFNRMTERLAGVLQSQRDFIADASHQLRTPLTGLRLRLEEAQERSSDPSVDSELAAAGRDLARLTLIVDDLLLLSRLGEREPTPVVTKLDALAIEAAERWARDADGRGVAIRVENAGPEPAWCLPEDVEHVLDALIENALLYGVRDGRGSAEVVIRAGPGRTIQVLDDGPGIAPGEAERVFERFHRGELGRRQAGGTGLGLAIARGLARAWGGDVTLENRPEGGAVASVGFPPPPSDTARAKP